MNASHLSSIITSYDLMIDAVFWLRVCVCVCVCGFFAAIGGAGVSRPVLPVVDDRFVGC